MGNTRFSVVDYFRNCNLFGTSLLFLTYLIFVFQIFSVYWIYCDTGQNLNETYFFFFRSVYLSFIVLAWIAHLLTQITNPGFINHNNNEYFLQLYFLSRRIAVKRALLYNQSIPKFVAPYIPDEDEDDLSDYAEDRNEFQENERNKLLGEAYKAKHNIDTHICKKCYIARVPGVHHCPKCHSCVYQMDHHCAWMSTCIGQFNQKYFILFCFYSALSSLSALFISIKYLLIPNFLLILRSILFGGVVLIHSLFSIWTLLFSGRLLYDQYDNVKDLTVNYDFKQNKMIEKRYPSEIITEIFGGPSSLDWGIPYKAGGFYSVFQKLSTNPKEKGD